MVKTAKKIKKEDPGEEKGTGKVESLVIFRCNCKCIMCSTGLQIDRSQASTDYHAIRPFEDVKKDIEKAKEMNARGFAFSGGEPTLRRDLAELVSYAKSLGISHIEVQSNGRMYSYKQFCQKMVDSGVNNFVISLHSCREKVHDQIMGVKGTFKQAVEGIKNLNSLGFGVKINVVLLKLNYEHLEEHVKFLLDNFKVEEIRFTMAMIEGGVLNNPEGIIAKISEVAPHVNKALDIAKGKTGCYVYNLVPCLLPGNEQYINDLGQLDTLLVGPEFETSLDESRRGKKVKSEKCVKCKYNDKCYGIWRSYAAIFGLEELRPVK